MLFTILLALMPFDQPVHTPLSPEEETRRDALTRFGLGVWRARQELPVQAVKQFEAAAKADPDSVETLRALVRLYDEIGRDAAAMRTATKLLELDPKDTDTAAIYGRLLVRSKRYGEASRAFKLATDQETKSLLKKLNLSREAARAAELAQDWQTAVELTQSSLSLLQKNRDALATPTTLQDTAGVSTTEAELLEKLAERCLSLKQFDEAIRSYEAAGKIWAALKQTMQVARLQWNLSKVFEGQEKYAEAIAALAKFVNLGPNGTEPYQRLAELLRKLNRAEEIVGTLAQLQARYPKIEAIRWVLAAETMAQNPAAGHREFEKLLDQKPSTKMLEVLVQAYTKNRQAQLLINIVRGLDQSQLTPDDDDKPKPLTPEQRAKAELLRQLTAAIKANSEASRELLNLDFSIPLKGDTLHFVQELAEQEGRSEISVQLARAYFEQDPEKGFPAYYGHLYRNRQWQAALDLCARAEQLTRGRVNRRGNSRLYSYDKAMPLAELNRGPEALAACDDVIRRVVADGQISAKGLKMRVLSVLGRQEEAIKLGLETIPLCSEPGQLRQLRLALYQPYNDLRRHAEAEKLLREQLEVDPDDALILNNLGYNLADEGRKLDEAEKMIRRALELDRDERARRGERELDNGSYLDSLGWVLFRRGKLDEARKALEAAVKSPDSNGDGIAWEHLGDVAIRQKDVASAHAAWRKAIDLYRDSHVGRQNNRRAEVLIKLEQTKQ
jgi:tetratricopeptide (TPR) repeat protein